MAQKIVYPTFKDAQQLYAKYSTIENISALYKTLQELIDSSYLSTMLENNIHAIYNKIILTYYPNEICIKSNFIKQVLMSDKKQVTIFELPVGTSRADLCKINGKSIAYEIKTDLDNLTRLTKQLTDYNAIFDEVYVICSETNLSKITELLPDTCGIYTYIQNRHGKYMFQLFRNPTENQKLNSLKQLNLLRKSELLSYFKIETPLLDRCKIIEYIAQNHTSDSINNAFKTILKHRFQKQWDFFKANYSSICEIDYQWFYKNQIEPSRIYK